MNPQQLRIFMQAADGRSLTEVASSLGLKQPTVTFHMQKLEQSVGLSLFRKQAGRVRLTDAGEALLPYAAKISALLDEASQLMTDYREQGRGRLKIGASYTPATYFLPAYLAEFQMQYPLALPTLTVKQAGDALALLESFEVDVAVVSLSEEPYPGLNVIPLGEDPLTLAFAPFHPLAVGEIGIEDLQGQPFLVHEGGSTSRRLSERWAAENGLNWQIRMELGAIETIKEAVKHGMGIGILPRRSARREELSGELVLRELPGKVSVRRICLVYRKEDEPVRQAAAFIDFMRAKLGV
ncbi:LysR family transcriptional regulator [Cohnella hashimotonis]|uniref:LysR family transcriptional regulator n=1 Tax=Cohnella hashimotonis TaxID=2826895 RepID=A0ABT6TU48_9BACL|nr:LysR family transcriptional regulator [Cohnella hashimotonis]MDI4650387.1 LysR family transcriptional regulator [Cohnella hashimotonis]